MTRVPPLTLIVSCEHASKELPPEFRDRLPAWARLLNSHLGWDPGALELAKRFSASRAATLFAAKVSRLVVDANRSESSTELISQQVAHAGLVPRDELLARYYHPYRDAVEATVREHIEKLETVLHLSVHSFTPVLHDHRRATAVGLLLDPARSREFAFCRAWQAALQELAPDLTVDLNKPYLGTSDGLTQTFRQRFREDRYLGIELEINQCFPLSARKGPEPSRWERLQDEVVRSFVTAGLPASSHGDEARTGP